MPPKTGTPRRRRRPTTRGAGARTRRPPTEGTASARTRSGRRSARSSRRRTTRTRTTPGRGTDSGTTGRSPIRSTPTASLPAARRASPSRVMTSAPGDGGGRSRAPGRSSCPNSGSGRPRWTFGAPPRTAATPAELQPASATAVEGPKKAGCKAEAAFQRGSTAPTRWVEKEGKRLVPRSTVDGITVDDEVEPVPVPVKPGVWLPDTKPRRDKLTAEQRAAALAALGTERAGAAPAVEAAPQPPRPAAHAASGPGEAAGTATAQSPRVSRGRRMHGPTAVTPPPLKARPATSHLPDVPSLTLTHRHPTGTSQTGRCFTRPPGGGQPGGATAQRVQRRW
ncbi:hypothetical protein SAMN04490357_7616 [Streptomyces misionensis]|uniref:Uncharacterized protein n=1 Tax=Streptomyces misionensis TaxID=67331 RepID=A0A1H5HSR4_9ACTN|nr:hypothetical protein SAMN04490357_7616 [Streptomyces misionensis]